MTTTDNVVALPGHTIAPPRGRPEPRIVAALEEALELARQGRVAGLGLAVVEDEAGGPAVHTQLYNVANAFAITFCAVKQLSRMADREADG